MTSDVRVLEVLPLSRGGIGRHVAQIAGGIGEGFEVDVAGPPSDVLDPTLSLDVPAGVSPAHALATRRLRSLAARYDVVHAHGIRVGISAGVAARRRTPVVLTVHNLVRPEIAGSRRVRLYRLAEPLAAALCDVVLAPSRQIAEHLALIAPRHASKIRVLYAGAPPPILRRPAEEVRAELGADGRRLVVSVARLAPQKALHVMLDALSLLPADVVLAIAGDGPLEGELRAQARELGVDARTRFLGYRQDAADIVNAADAFCLSSIWEAVSLAAQEAVMLGTPVVATRAGGMDELIEDGVSGRLVAVDDPEQLAEALGDVLTRATGQRYAAAARSAYAQRFSAAAMLEGLRSLYRELGAG